MLVLSLLYNFTRLGSRVSLLESLLMLLLPVALIDTPFYEWLTWNGLCQFGLFVPIVILPTVITGHMSYVDIGWPWGLTLLGLNTWWYGTGWWVRRGLAALLMILHGARMGLGALVLMYPYRWKEDRFPRYRYAKLRWEQVDHMPPSLWSVKMVHDVVQQAFANTVALAIPLVLLAHNSDDQVYAVEVIALFGWGSSWLCETMADAQKIRFELNTKSSQELLPVLGYAPYDGKEYSWWTRCRHPNYFFEWCSWISWCIASLPSLFSAELTMEVKCALGLMLILIPRFFFDCLNYWTGAEPAEYFSYTKRPLYAKYQQSTRVFWPFELQGIDHGKSPGWPNTLIQKVD